MSDKQKVYVDTGVIGHLDPEILKRWLEQVVEEKPVTYCELDSFTTLPVENELIPEKPLWVIQQENKKLRRK